MTEPLKLTEPLERRYRRLLLAYPRRYRRTRGVEMLTTLLDASRPGQRRPAWRDALNVVAGGLRCRLALPGRGWVATGVVLVALAAAGVGAAGGARLGWRGAPDLPTDSQFTASAERLGFSRLALDPDMAAQMNPYHEVSVTWIPVRALRGGPYDNETGLVVSPFAATPSAALMLVQDRLLADGWRPDTVRTIGEHTVLTAHQHGLKVIVAAQPVRGGLGPRSILYLALGRDEPRPVLPLTIVGALLFFALGWLGAAAVMRRAASRAHAAQAAILAAAIAAIGLLLPTTLVTWMVLVTGHPVDPAWYPPPPAWAAYAAPLGWYTVVAGGVLALVAVLLATVAPAARSRAAA